MPTAFRLLPRALLIAAILVTITSRAADAPAKPEAAVRAFNAAISEQRLEAALATLAPGAVKFNFGSSHRFSGASGAPEPLTSDLAVLWRTVAPVLYSTNRQYRRDVLDATTHVDGPLAIVWARIRTTAEARDGKRSTLEFAESYVLRLAEGEWRIAGVANARPTR